LNEYAQCQACALAQTRTRLVFGAGNPKAELMFVGEAPGYDEDQQGMPFVGAAGQLLTKIIEAMKLKREDVYIANCLKCRPPQNRNPLPGEIAACHPILSEQIRIIEPKIICALGKFAAQTLLKSEEPISRLRGRFFDFGRAKLIATFHPAYLLRNPSDKRLVWEDMQKIMVELRLK
jgi:DNA polymerase